VPASPAALLHQRAYRAPRFPLERVVTDVLAECLQISTLGIDDNFFESVDTPLLGDPGRFAAARHLQGRSAGSRRIRDADGGQLSAFLLNAPDAKIGTSCDAVPAISAMGDNEVDALLASEVELPVSETGEPAFTPIQPARDTSISGTDSGPRRGGPAPLSLPRSGWWFLNQYSPESPAYNTLAPLPLLEPINVAALQHSLTEMVRPSRGVAHDFRVIDGTPMQIVAAEGDAPLIVKDYRNLPAEEGRAAGMAFIKAEALRPFDLEARSAAARAADAAGRRSVATGRDDAPHHLRCLVAANLLQRPDYDLPGVLPWKTRAACASFRVQYADFAQWQRENASGRAAARELTLLTRQLSDALPSSSYRPIALAR